MGDGSNGTADKVILRFTAPVLVGSLGVCGYFFQQSHTNLYNAIERDRANTRWMLERNSQEIQEIKALASKTNEEIKALSGRVDALTQALSTCIDSVSARVEQVLLKLKGALTHNLRALASSEWKVLDLKFTLRSRACFALPSANTSLRLRKEEYA